MENFWVGSQLRQLNMHIQDQIYNIYISIIWSLLGRRSTPDLYNGILQSDTINTMYLNDSLFKVLTLACKPHKSLCSSALNCKTGSKLSNFHQALRFYLTCQWLRKKQKQKHLNVYDSHVSQMKTFPINYAVL